jgi:DNA polymerase
VIGGVLSIDFETASLLDLRRTGVYEYAAHNSTQVLCMSYAFDDEPVQIWYQKDPFPQRVIDHVRFGGRVRAWNAGFELTVWNRTLVRQLIWGQSLPMMNTNQIEDTMARAAYWGLPLSLDQAAPAAGLAVQKDKLGHALMMRMSKPRSVNPVTGDVVWWHETDPVKYTQLGAYCQQDVVVERAIANVLPPLPDPEQETWIADQEINRMGVGVDIPLVSRLANLAEEAARHANDYLSRLTGGQVRTVTSTAKLLEFLRAHGYPHDNLRKDTVAQRLDEEGLSDIEREVLELRADTAKTSAAKLRAMLDASSTRQDIGTVRGMLQYYGASRTGRWAGRLIQLQNLPRGDIKNISDAIRMILAGATYDQIEALFGNVMSVVTSALRGCIVARSGLRLVVADFAQIEARVVAWLAGQLDILDVFRRGEDVYTHTANQIGSADRQLGKVLVLACGFGMSWRKFQETAAKQKVTLSDLEAERAVRGWRNNNNRIVSFWWDCDHAARSVIANPKQVVSVGPVKFGMMGQHMLVRLPSGRNLVYREARLVPSQLRPGDMEISYMGVNQYTRKWERLRTYGGKLVENITQATARDIMRDAMLEAGRAAGLRVLLTVHDELICESLIPVADMQLRALLALMRKPPAWALDLPVGAEGWVGDRYKK